MVHMSSQVTTLREVSFLASSCRKKKMRQGEVPDLDNFNISNKEQ